MYEITREFVDDNDGVLGYFSARDKVVELCRKHGLDEVDAIREDDAVPVDGRDRGRRLVHDLFDGEQLDGVARAEFFNLSQRGLAETRTDAC